MSFNSKYSGQQVENLLDQVANGNTGGGGDDITNGKINGDGTITKIVKVSALPDNPDANTLYIIV